MLLTLEKTSRATRPGSDQTITLESDPLPGIFLTVGNQPLKLRRREALCTNSRISLRPAVHSTPTSASTGYHL